MRRTRDIVVCLTVATLVGLVALAGAASVTRVSIAASQQGGAWYPLAVAIGELLKGKAGLEDYSVLPGGGASNPVAVDEGKATFGISTAVSSVDAYKGNPPYKRAYDKVRLVAAQYLQYVHFFTLEGANIASVKDLKGKRVNVGRRGLTGEVVAQAMLKANGMSYADLAFVSHVGFADATNEMRDRRVDAIIWITDAPFARIKELAQTHTIKLIPLAGAEADAVRKLIPGLVKAAIPAGVYKGIDQEIPTLMSPNVLLAGADVDAEFVYKVTKTYVENFARLQEASPPLRQVKDARQLASVDLAVPFHAGAERYYKERGWR